MLEILIFILFSANTIYVLTLSIAGHFYRKKVTPEAQGFKRIAVLVPGYKEDSVIVSVAESLSTLEYPKNLFDIFVIADSFKPETLSKLSELPIKLISVEFEKSSKSKSLNYAFSVIKEKYEIAIILDADNVVLKNFLISVNNAFNAGYHTIQAQRVAKNINTSFAMLDAASEAINNHLFRKGPNALGLSACLIGSGIIMDFSILKKILISIDSVYEDRELQLELAKQCNKIYYMEDILVFDEKVDNAASYQNQRKRWFYAQLVFLKDHFLKGFLFLLKGNLNYFNFSVLNNIFPPRLISVFFLAAMTLLSFLFRIDDFYTTKWFILFSLYVAALFLALPKKFYTIKMLKAFGTIPILLFKYIEILLGMRTAGKQFIHTPHSKIDIDNNLFSGKRNI